METFCMSPPPGRAPPPRYQSGDRHCPCERGPLRTRRGGGLALLRVLRDGVARLLPPREAAVHLADGLEPHLLGDVGGQGRPPGAVAEEDELLPGGEDFLVVGALRVDPELEHAAGAVESAGDDAVPLELTHVPQVDEGDVVPPVASPGLVQPDGPDARFRLVHHLAKAFPELHQFAPSSRGARACGRLGRPSSRKTVRALVSGRPCLRQARPPLISKISRSLSPGVRSHNVTGVPMVATGDDFRKEGRRERSASPWFLWLPEWPGPCL